MRVCRVWSRVPVSWSRVPVGNPLFNFFFSNSAGSVMLLLKRGVTAVQCTPSRVRVKHHKHHKTETDKGLPGTVLSAPPNETGCRGRLIFFVWAEQQVPEGLLCHIIHTLIITHSKSMVHDTHKCINYRTTSRDWPMRVTSIFLFKLFKNHWLKSMVHLRKSTL